MRSVLTVAVMAVAVSLTFGSGFAEAGQAGDDVMYYCPVCDSGFISEADWQHYMQLNHPEVNIEGKAPIKTTKKGYETVMAAKKEGRDVDVLYCPICNSGFITEAEWQQHLEVNHPEAAGKAEKPQKMSRKEFARKMAAGSAGDQEIYYCPVCDSGFISEAEWRHYLQLNYPDVDITGKKPMKIKKSELGEMKEKHHKGSEHKKEMRGSRTK